MASAAATAVADVKCINVPADRWFVELFGFDERSCRDTAGRVDPDRLRANFEFDNSTGLLRSKVNGAAFHSGIFTTPSLQELRDRARQRGLLPAAEPHRRKRTRPPEINGRCRLVVRHIATRDVFDLHTREAHAGATFMAASQFNCLEFPGPRVVPEDGVTQYVYDHTQGPACALAAPASTLVRNYFAVTNGHVGQSRENQLNNLAGVLASVNGTDLVRVQNGYTSSDDGALTELNRRIAEACAPVTGSSGGGGGDGNGDHGAGDDAASGTAASTSLRDALLGHLRVGLHAKVEVPWAPNGRFQLLPEVRGVWW
jgi:hypothetical protein